jgi:hypothetical protein
MLQDAREGEARLIVTATPVFAFRFISSKIQRFAFFDFF